MDNAPLRAAAWHELQTARRKLEKATRDLHRHEETDVPGFRAWLGTKFAALVSDVRELTLEVNSKAHLVDEVQTEALFTAKSPRSIWRAWQRCDPAPDTGSNADAWDSAETDESGRGSNPWDAVDEDLDDSVFEEAFDMFCAESGFDPDAPEMKGFAGFVGDMMGFDLVRPRVEARENAGLDIFRRLVQRLHPDRGGDWTPERERRWHQVQEAWANRDVDMLARLEAECDIAEDTLGPECDVGRLRAAVEEIHAARRDAERKVRIYRKDPAWRFSLKPPDARRSAQLRRSLEEQCLLLRQDLAELDGIIADWERPTRKHKPRKKRRTSPERASASAQAEFVFG